MRKKMKPWFGTVAIAACFSPFILYCRIDIPSTAGEQQDQTAIVLELPAGLDADVYRISIAAYGAADTLVYYKMAHSMVITVAVPATVSSVVTVEAFKDNGIIYMGKAEMASGAQGAASLVQQAIEPPVTPVSLTVSLTAEGKVSVRWQPGGFAQSTKLYRTTDTNRAPDLICTSIERQYTDAAVVSGLTYYYRVSSINVVGESVPTAYVAIAIPDSLAAALVPPEGLAAIALSQASIRISYKRVTAASSYIIYCGSSGDNLSELNFLQDTAFVHTDLAPQTAYYYAVASVTAKDTSCRSAVAGATTHAPPQTPPAAGPHLAVGACTDSSVSLSWQAVDKAARYVIERGSASSGPFAVTCTTAALSLVDRGLVPSSTYYYRGCAANQAGASPYSAVVAATTQAPPQTPPAAGPYLAVGACTDSSVVLSWGAVDKATRYIIERGSASTGPFVAACTTATYSWTDGGRNASTTYYYRGKSTNSAGVSPYSPVVPATTLARLLPPASLEKTAVTTSSVTLTWQPAAGAQFYRIYRSQIVTGPFAGISEVTATQCTDTGLTASTNYWYKVSSNSGNSESAQSSALAVTTAASPPAPTGLTATVNGTTIAIKFNAVTGASGYKLYWSVDTGAFTAITLNATSYNHTGLTANTTYHYKVSAIKQSVESAQSSIVTAKTTQAAKVAKIDPAKCNGCGRCPRACSRNAIYKSGGVYVIDPAKCNGCGDCIDVCPLDAISIQ